MEKRDNYKIQVAQAKAHFLTYDQHEMIERCGVKADEKFIYIRFLGENYRICRENGDMDRLHCGQWIDGNGFAEVMTILDWLCDSREDRYITGRWVNIVNQGPYFHRNLQEESKDPDAEMFCTNPEKFVQACEALHGEKMSGGDISYAIELIDGLKVLVQLWYGDEEFPHRLRFLWDENTTRYIRYETTWYALGLLKERLRAAANIK